MEPVVEGGIEVASPPAGAGRRGTITSPDWSSVYSFISVRPWRWFFYPAIPAGQMTDLRRNYNDCEWRTCNTRMKHTPKGEAQRVCDVYVRWTGESHDNSD